LDEPVEVARAPPQRLQGYGEHAVRVAHRHTDARVTEVDRHSYTTAHAPGPQSEVTRSPTACSIRCSAASMRATSAPPPWATSSLPPPLPPISVAPTRTSALADRPHSRAASLTATTSEGLPPPEPAIATTAGRSPGSRPR